MAEMNIDVSKKPTINISNPKTNDGIQIISPGTRNHNQLHNLDYDNSGHTGFQRELNFDDTPTAGSLNPVTSGGIKTYVDNKIAEGGGGSTITIDSALSDTSTNPVQNKVIKNALDTKQDTLTFDNWPTTFSDNPVTSGAVRSALDLKADKTHTLSGYGIEDAYTKTEVDTKLSTVYKVKGSANDYNIFEMYTNHEVGDVYNLQGVYTTSYNTTVDKNAFHYTYDSGTSKQYLVAYEISAAYQWLNNAKIKIHTGTDTKTGVLIETTAVPGWELILDDGGILTSDVYNTVTSIDLTVYHDFKVGDNVVYIKGGFWDKLAATVDLSGYQDKLTFDDIPTADSTNPVTSGGVKTALDGKLDKTDAVGQKTAKGGEIFNKYEEDPDGPKNIAGECAHAEGYTTTASGANSHAEGGGTIASGWNSHAEGRYTQATGTNSHAEGSDSEAKGYNSHAEGFYTIASKEIQHVQGKYNIEDTTTNGYAHIVGNGSAPDNRSNAHTLDWNGNAWYKGDVKIGGTSYDDSAAKSLATIDDVRPAVKNAIDTIAVNTIYDLGVQTALNITLPSGQIGDFIEFDFISGETATTLTVNSSSGLVGFDLIPGTNTVYTLYFDWGVTGYDGTYGTYGWRCNYSEYSITV